MIRKALVVLLVQLIPFYLSFSHIVGINYLAGSCTRLYRDIRTLIGVNWRVFRDEKEKRQCARMDYVNVVYMNKFKFITKPKYYLKL